MTVPVETSFSTFTTDGSTTTFPIPFTWTSATNVNAQVTVNDAVISAPFSVTGTSGSSSIVFNTAPPAGTGVMYRTTPVSQVQSTPFASGGVFPNQALATGLDQLTRIAQEITDQADRALTFSIGETGYMLPPPTSRLGLYLGFDAVTGAPTVVPGIGTATAASLVTYTPSGPGATSRSINSWLADISSVKDRGAVGNGTNDDTTAFSTASGVGPFIVPPGTYKITANLTVSSFVTFEPGAMLAIASGITVTFAAGISAPIAQIFSGAGSVVFSPCPVTGYAEWWGAVNGSSAAASTNLAAINSALAALTVTNLLPGDYWVSGTIVHATGGHTLAGAGAAYNSSANQATRIICTSGSATILQVGASTNPGSPNGMPVGIRVRDLFIIRSVAPVISSNCDGLAFQYVANGEVRNVKSQDSINSFHITGVVGSDVRDCQATRVTAGSGTGTDNWNGYFLDGSHYIGAAGGNASIYLTRCSAGCNLSSLQTTASNGFYLYAGNYGIQDTFLDHCETVSCYIGTLVGNGAGGQADVRIVHQTDDQVNKYGILLTGLTSTSVIDLTDYYCGPGSAAQFAGYINNCLGSISIKGGQLLMNYSGQSGLAISGSVGVSVRGMAITETNAGNPVVFSGSSNCVIEPIIHNANNACSGGAVQVSGTCVANRFAPLIYGKASAFGMGIQVIGTADSRNTYDVGAIDSGCVAGGYANKLTRNGATALSSATMVPAYVGTNLVTGCAG